MTSVLYLSCHSILENLEVTLFSQLGYGIFSPGAYLDPSVSPDGMRPPLNGVEYDQSIVEQWHRLAALHPGEDTKYYLTREFVDNFDVVLVMHLPDFIHRNWEAMKHKRVIWRTIGQSISPVEKSLQRYRAEGMEIVRYSPMERNIPGYIGEDALIRFYVDEDLYSGWTGEQNRIINFTQDMRRRDAACNFSFFDEVTQPFPRHLFGPGNEGLSWSSGKITPEQQLIEYRTNRCYFYCGTKPASYTLNGIEALSVGIPMVCIGPEHGNWSSDHKLYEMPHIIKNGINGFISDNREELQDYITSLLSDYDLAKSISTEGRKTAIDLFGKKEIATEWSKYIG